MGTPDETPTSLAERVRQRRNVLGLSQEALVSRLLTKVKVTRSAVAQWETGRAMPDRENLWALAEVLGVSAEWLKDGVGPDEELRAHTAEEAVLLRLYRKVPPDRQDELIRVVKVLSGPITDT